jgi:hypothetical protein
MVIDSRSMEIAHDHPENQQGRVARQSERRTSAARECS